MRTGVCFGLAKEEIRGPAERVVLDNRLYWPMVGWALLVSEFLRVLMSERRAFILAVGVTGGALLIFGYSTLRYCHSFENATEFSQAALEASPNSALARHLRLSVILPGTTGYDSRITQETMSKASLFRAADTKKVSLELSMDIPEGSPAYGCHECLGLHRKGESAERLGWNESSALYGLTSRTFAAGKLNTYLRKESEVRLGLPDKSSSDGRAAELAVSFAGLSHFPRLPQLSDGTSCPAG